LGRGPNAAQESSLDGNGFPVPRTGEDGKPIYDQQFFLALARLGKDTWNRWRAAHPRDEKIQLWEDDPNYIAVTFEGVDFREPAHAVIDFSGFDFGNDANFSGCRFGDGPSPGEGKAFRPGMANFSGATFGNEASFSGATFGDEADLSGATFGEGANLSGATFGYVANLSGATFGDGANLSRATFASRTNLSGATFGDWAGLAGATFGDRASLSGATFGYEAKLFGAIFGHGVNLSGATFGDSAKLSGATFGNGADLSGASFGHRANLSGVTFGGWANLSGATFGVGANLSGATFRGWANLSGVTFGFQANLSGADFGDFAWFTAWSEDKWRENRFETIQRSTVMQAWSGGRRDAFLNIPKYLAAANAGPDTFLDLSFSRARFKGRADFSGRKFLGEADFTQAEFGKPPRFADCTGFERIDFTGAQAEFGEALRVPLSKYAPLLDWWFGIDDLVLAKSGWTTESDIAVQLRRLRALVEDTKNHDFERDLYIEERKAERGIFFMQFLETGEKGRRGRPLYSWKRAFQARFLPHCLWIAVMFFYSLLADYGRSFVRPALALALSVLFFHWAYGAVLYAPLDANKQKIFDRALWAFAISNAVPFVGALTLERDVKLTLLCGDAPISAEKAQQPNPAICAPIPGRRFQLLALLQSIVSALCVFFIALALRNYFKLK
jgi:hypothetical protein